MARCSASTTTDSDGNYAFAPPANTNVFVRARAQARRTTAPTLDIRVLNNTGGNALYVLDGSVFNTGVGAGTLTRNLSAGSGWGGTGYVEVRAAAPFAILDTLYAAAEFVHDNGASVNLPPLDAFWSPLNNPNDGNVASGNIISTLYRTAPVAPGDPPQGIYVLGLENVDTDEYDAHVLAHEFQHYLEDNLGRTDTTGGEHATNERLDMRLAFSEGFANAFSGMVLNNPVYRDTQGPQQGQSFFFNMESNFASPAGWFNEGSIHSIAWDLFDSAADAPDAVQVGFRPMYEAFVGPLRTGAPLTSIYPFLTVHQVAARRFGRGHQRACAGTGHPHQRCVRHRGNQQRFDPGGAADLHRRHAQCLTRNGVRQCDGRRLQQARQPPVPALYARREPAGLDPGHVFSDGLDRAVQPGVRSGHRAVPQRVPRHCRDHHGG